MSDRTYPYGTAEATGRTVACPQCGRPQRLAPNGVQAPAGAYAAGFMVRVQPDDQDGGWTAIAVSQSAFAGAAGQGETAAEALRDIADAVEGIEDLRQERQGE